jgi:hypothetical protein
VIERHPFLEPAECEAICARVAAHPELGRERNPAIPDSLVTYGLAAYIDAAGADGDPERDYHAPVAAENQRLEGLLGDLYPRLRSRLEELLEEPAAYAPELLALPGLHVFRGSGIAGAARVGDHFDLQFRSLRFPAPADEAEPISVTLPLHLPAGGGGLRVYPVTLADLERAQRAGRAVGASDLAARKPSIYEEYEVGTLFVHRGLYLHGIAAPRAAYGPEEERITLQCHGIRAGGTWWIYW